MSRNTFDKILNNLSTGKLFAVLIDPDKSSEENCRNIVEHKIVDLIFVGGSLLSKDFTEKTIGWCKKYSDKPVILFPGSINQISGSADALLFLSLISGRNAEMLIGQHVVAAPLIKALNLETIPTGYMLFESGKLNTAQYISQTMPLPSNRADIAVATALAGEMLGLKILYLDAGSGAEYPVSIETITKVKESVSVPIIVGGGLRTSLDVSNAFLAGADIVVVGNIIEENPEFLNEIKKYFF